jgi:hypothetical protein
MQDQRAGGTHFLLKIDADASSSDDDDNPLDAQQSSLHKFLIPTQLPSNNAADAGKSMLRLPTNDSVERKLFSKEEDISSVTMNRMSEASKGEEKSLAPKSAMDKIMTFTQSKRRESISRTQGLEAVEMNPEMVANGGGTLLRQPSNESITENLFFMKEDKLFKEKESRPIDKPSIDYFKPSDELVVDPSIFDQHVASKYRSDTNVRRKIVKLSSETLREMFPEKIDIGSLDINKEQFDAFLEEARVIPPGQSKPLVELREMCFRICSALSRIMSWDDIFLSLNESNLSLNDNRWINLSSSDVVRGALAEDLTKEGIIGFMFFVHGVDNFRDSSLQKVLEEIRIRRFTFKKVFFRDLMCLYVLLI